jgi:predicted nucleic acid-binding protein
VFGIQVVGAIRPTGVIVSNASPLINLARIGRLDFLHQLYGELMIPEAVWLEVVIEGTIL